MRTLRVAAAALSLLLAGAAFGADTAVPMVSNGYPMNSSGSQTLTLAGTNTTCGSNAIVFPVNGAGSMQLGITGTFTSGSLKIKATEDGTNFSADMKVQPRGGGPQAVSITATGNYMIQARADSAICVYSASFSGTIVLLARTLPWTNHNEVTPFKSSIAGSGIACNSGTSPCTITNSAADVLNSNAARKACSLQAVGVVDLYCKRATAAGSAATSSNFDFLLSAGSGALKGGGTWLCHDAGAVWTGPVNCIASGASVVADLAVNEIE